MQEGQNVLYGAGAQFAMNYLPRRYSGGYLYRLGSKHWKEISSKSRLTLNLVRGYFPKKEVLTRAIWPIYVLCIWWDKFSSPHVIFPFLGLVVRASDKVLEWIFRQLRQADFHISPPSKVNAQKAHASLPRLRKTWPEYVKSKRKNSNNKKTHLLEQYDQERNLKTIANCQCSKLSMKNDEKLVINGLKLILISLTWSGGPWNRL